MWIRVNTHDGPRFSIPVPLSLAGSRFVWRMVAKYNGGQTTDLAPYAADIARELRSYVRRNGHFTLVDVQSSEGDTVKITV